MQRALIVILSIILIVGGGIALYLTFADFSGLETDLEQEVFDITGRELRVDGDFELEVMPPSLAVSNVTFDNADWASDEPALSIGHFSAALDGISLFSDMIVIDDFQLRDVRILVEQNADGESNWDIEIEEDDDGIDVDIQVDADDESGILLKQANLENVAVILRRPGEEDREFSVDNLEVRSTDEDLLVAEGNGNVNGQAASLSGSVGPVDNLSSGRNLDVSLDANLGLIAFSMEGNSGNPATLAGTALESRMTIEDIAVFADMLDLPAGLSGPVEIDANVRGVEGVPTIEAVAGLGDLEASGAVTLNDERLSVDLSVSSLADLGAILDAGDLPEGPALARGDVLIAGNEISLFDFLVETSLITATTTLTAAFDDDSVELDPFSLQTGESDLSGTLSVSTADPIQVQGEFRSTLLDLTPLTGAGTTESEDEASAEPAAPVETTPDDDGFLLKEDPLPFEFLNAANVDVSLLIEEFRNGPMQLRQVQGTVKLADGTLTVDGGLDVSEGGEADANMTLVSAGDSATLDIDFELSGFRPTQEATDERSLEDIPLMGLTVDIESAGNSAHAIAAAANGKLILTQGVGKIDNAALGLFSADVISELFTALNPFAKDEPYSNWECTVVGMNVVDGVATMTSMLAQSEKVTIVGDGAIDFNDESLDISFNTKPRQGVGVSADMFVTPFVRMGGTLSSPRLALDKSGVLISGGAAVLTGGLSFLVQGAADRASGAQDRCSAALAIAEGREVEVGEARE